MAQKISEIYVKLEVIQQWPGPHVLYLISDPKTGYWFAHYE